MPAKLHLIGKINVAYTKSQLETGEPSRVKRALQDLCKLYRHGGRIRPEQLIGIEQTIVGLLQTQGGDEKVRRWALNALARLGKADRCLDTICHILQKYVNEPQTAAAAIAAVFKLTKEAPNIIERLDVFDKKLVALAALQQVEPNQLDLSEIRIDIEKAEADYLKLALVVVGLDRAPPNLFHPRYSNSAIVKVLGAHDDNVVAQYSVWAITENPSLGLNDLGLDINLIEGFPTNVRSWVLQLIGMDKTRAQDHMEYIKLGASDQESGARLGLAVGLKENYFDGLEPLVLEWLYSEEDGEIRQALTDHLVLQSNRCVSYEAAAIEIYKAESSASQLRFRMDANAATLPLYAKFKALGDDGMDDLFGGRSVVVNNIRIKGNMQGAAVSIGGNATSSGNVSLSYNQKTTTALRTQLKKAERQISRNKSTDVKASLRKQVLESIRDAHDEPTPAKVSRALSLIKKVAGTVTKVAGAGAAIAHTASEIGNLAGLS